MKNFRVLFLVALMSSTSFSNLKSQVENQVRGNRLQVAGINQTTSRRLQSEEHQVTVQEYCDFLNAVGVSDPHRFYEEWMGSDPNTACIARVGTPGNYSYSVVEGKGGMSISEVNVLNQARYCNWLENGQPKGSQTPETTEDGVYTLKGDKVVVVNPNTTYLLKSDNNQDTGDREDRLEAIGYRLEGAERILSGNTTANCDNSSENLNCYLMMEPAAIEEAGKSFKRELGISEGKESLVQTTSTHANVFTIVQNHTSASNTFSSSSQHIDPALKEQTQRGISKVINNASTQLHDHYKKADEAWGECDHGWQEYSRIYHDFQEGHKQLTLSNQKLEQATKATTNEELQKTRLAKISKYAGIAGGMIGSTPEPNSQAVSIGVSALGAFAGAINLAWAHGNLALIKREHQRVSEQYALIQERKGQIQKKLPQLKQHAEVIETLAVAEVEQASRKLAEQLHPQTDWKESQCQAWGTLIGSTWSEKDKLHLINLVRLDPSWVEEATRKSWEQKVEAGKAQYITLQKKANLASLKRHYESALQQHQRVQTQEEQQRKFLDQGQNLIQDLKSEIEKQADDMERLETRDKVQFGQKKKEFIEKLGELEKTQLRLQVLQKKWEEAVQRTTDQEEQRWIASETYQNAKEEAERTFARVKKAYQTDRELLQKIWLKSASSNYKDWSLPEIGTSQGTENDLDSFEEKRTGEECMPPIQRLKEIEDKGRNLRLKETIMSSLSTTKNAEGSNTLVNSIVKMVKHQFSRQASFLPSQSNLDQVREWVQQKQDHPSSHDQERWDIREKLDQLYREISAKRKELKEDSFLEGQMRNSNEMDDDDDDGKSKFSTATKRTVSSQASYAPSTLSVGKSSVLSFAGFGKKKTTSSLPSINEESQNLQENSQEKLKQLQEQAGNLKKRYFELLDQAENERLSLFQGQKEAVPFNEETDRNYAWEEADRKSVALIQEKRRREEEGKIAQEEQKSWQTNTERWRLRAQADQAFKVFRRAQQWVLKLGEEADKAKTKAQLTEVDRKKEEALAEEKRLKQAYFTAEEEWEKIVQEYHDESSGQSIVQEKAEEETQEQANERLKERDRAVNKRWEKLLRDYQNPGLEKSAVEQEEISEAIMTLESQLDQVYTDSFITYSDQKALAHYREVAFKRALENARNHPEEMAEFWKKIRVKEKKPTSQQEINKQAAEAFVREAKRLERIEKIWKGILETEQEEAKQTREQAAQEYYQGNSGDWNVLSEQERTRYNNESKKANEEYDQKRDEAQEVITAAQAEKLTIAAEVKRVERMSWISITSTKRKEKLNRCYQQLEELENTIKKTSQQLNEQEEFLKIGQKARPKENYYEALTQVQKSEEKAREQKNNPYWQQAAECYEKAGRYWNQSTNDNNREIEQQENEKIATNYGRAAEAYQKAAEEQTAFITTQNRGRESLIKLYEKEGGLYKQLAEQLEKGGIKADTSEIEENLYQLEKKIARYLGTRGAQIEELQENIPLLQKRGEELNKEIAALHQQDLDSKNRVLSKLADADEVQGASEHKSRNVYGIPEELSTGVTKQFAAGVEFRKKSKENLATSLRELITSCQKALEDLLQESPESGENAAKILKAIESHRTKDQELQQTIDQTLQLQAKVTPLEQRAVLLSSEATAAQEKGELFLAKGQQRLAIQLSQALEHARKLHNQLLVQTEGSADTAAQCQTCMDKLQQLEEQDHYLKKIVVQLQQLNQNKNVLTTRMVTLKDDIKIAQSQGEAFLVQGQEKLLGQASIIHSEVDPIAEQLLTKAEKASEQANSIILRSTQFQQQDKALQENTTSLREFGQKKISLQKREETLRREVTDSKNRGEVLLNEGQQQLLHGITQALSNIEQTSKQILAGDRDASEQGIALRSQLKQLEDRDQALGKNIPTLLTLEQKKNHFQDRLKNLTAEIAASCNQGKVFLNEAQESLAQEITQFLSKIDQNARQLLANDSEAPAIAKLLLTQLDQLVLRDQQLQKNAPALLKLDEKKKFFQDRLEALGLELKSPHEYQHHLATEKQRVLSNEINQSLVKIDQSAKQLLSGTAGSAEQAQTVLSELSVLEQRDQRLNNHLVQLSDLKQKETFLKTREGALEGEIITSQIRGEITLAQAQQTLLEEISKLLQQTSQAAKQLLVEDQGTSEVASQRMKELIPLLDQLRVRDERLQKNAFSLRDLEQKKKILRERVETFKNEVVSLQELGEPLLVQQQQTLLETFQRSVDQASVLITQLMEGTDQALEQAPSFFQEIDKLQLQDQQLKENVLKVQELEQKKNILQQRLATLSSEVSAAHSQGEPLIAQGQQTLVSKMKGVLSRIDETTEQLRKGVIGMLPTAEEAKTLLGEIAELEQRDDGFQKNIPQLRECLGKGSFLHDRTTALKGKISSAQSSQNPGEQIFVLNLQKLLNDYSQMQAPIEEVIKQLLTGNKEASEQARLLLTQIKQLEQREATLQAEETARIIAEEKALKEKQEMERQAKAEAERKAAELRDQQLKENALKVQELEQKKNILQRRFVTLSEEVSAAHSQGESRIAEGQQTLVTKMKGMLLRIDEATEQLRKSTGMLPTTERANLLLAEIVELEQQDDGFQKNIPQLRECLEKGSFLYERTTALKEKIISTQSSLNQGEQLFAQGQQKLLNDYSQMQAPIEAVINQLLTGSKEVSQQAKDLLVQIKQLEQREQSLQKNTPTILELEQKQAALQARAEVLRSEIASSRNRGETVITPCQQNLLEAIQGARGHAFEFITQLINKVDNTLDSVEAHKRVQAEDIAKITIAEKALQAIEKKAKADAEKKAAEELKEAIKIATATWNTAGEITRQADAAKVFSDKDQTEKSYQEVNRLAQEASNAWSKAAEAHNVALSKASEADKSSLQIKVKMAASRKDQYEKLAIEALKNAKEKANKKEEHIAELQSKANNDRRLSEETKKKTLPGSQSAFLYESAATSWEKAVLAQNNSQQEVSSYWEKFAMQYEALAELVNASFNKATNLNMAFHYSVDRLQEAVNLLGKTVLAENVAISSGTDLSFFWKKSVEQYYTLSELYSKVCELDLTERKLTDSSLRKFFDLAAYSSDGLERASTLLEEITSFKSEKNPQECELSSLSINTVEQNQLLAEFYRKAVEAVVGGDKNLIDCFDKANRSARRSAYQLEKAAALLKKMILLERLENPKKVELLSFWKKTIEDNQNIAKQYRASAEAYASGNREEGERLSKVTSDLEKQSDIEKVAVEEAAEAAEEREILTRVYQPNVKVPASIFQTKVPISLSKNISSLSSSSSLRKDPRVYFEMQTAINSASEKAEQADSSAIIAKMKLDVFGEAIIPSESSQYSSCSGAYIASNSDTYTLKFIDASTKVKEGKVEGSESLPLLDEAIQRGKYAEYRWNETIKILQVAIDNTVGDNSSWIKQLEVAKNKKAIWVRNIMEYEAKRETIPASKYQGKIKKRWEDLKKIPLDNEAHKNSEAVEAWNNVVKQMQKRTPDSRVFLGKTF